MGVYYRIWIKLQNGVLEEHIIETERKPNVGDWIPFGNIVKVELSTKKAKQEMFKKLLAYREKLIKLNSREQKKLKKVL